MIKTVEAKSIRKDGLVMVAASWVDERDLVALLSLLNMICRAVKASTKTLERGAFRAKYNMMSMFANN